MNKVYLLLGSNMGNSIEQLTIARKRIAAQIGAIQRTSGIYQTAAWGFTAQPDFVNQVLICQTNLPAPEIMRVILTIEAAMGRKRSVKNAPRIIDIDILYFNKHIIDTDELKVPHPAIAARRFVLIPLNELSPAFVHPVHKVSNHALLLACTDTLDVKKI